MGRKTTSRPLSDNTPGGWGGGRQLLASVSADSRESGGEMKSPLIPLSPNLWEEPENGGYSRSGRRGLREEVGSGEDVDKKRGSHFK